jgi:hypothetical protein
MSIYNKLGFDSSFDITKFGDALDLSDGTKQLFSIQKNTLKQWQIDDIDNDVDITYYKNPLINDLVSCNNSIKNIRTKTDTGTYNYLSSGASAAANTLNNTCNDAVLAISNFILHTNRLSGLEDSSNTSAYPDLESAMNIGKKMLTLTNKTDNVQNNAPILGNFTSLYIGDDLSTYANTVSDDYITLNASIYSGNNNTFISASDVNLINSHVNSLYTMLNTRRTSDVNFYKNCIKISKKISATSKFSNMGGSHTKLVELIGTDELKSRLNS